MDSFLNDDFIRCLRTSRTDWHYDSRLIREHFGVTNHCQVKDFGEKVNEFTYRIIAYNLDEFLKQNDIQVSGVHNVDIEEDNPAVFTRIEIAPGQYSFIYKRVNLFLKKDKSPYILSIEKDYNPSNSYQIRIASLDVSGQKILQDLLKFGEERNFYKKQKIDAGYSFIKSDRKYDWSDIVLPEDVKEKLQKNINNFIEATDIYKVNNIQMKRGIILKGPPGTGKTLVGKILCSQTDWSFIWVPPQFVRQGLITEFCAAARTLSPTILFLEDLDLYAEDRDANSNKALLGQLMNELDGIQENNQILVVATTNKADNLEEAILNRPGRFDIVIELPAPTKEQILSMLTLFSKNVILDKDVDFQSICDAIISKKVKYSGAHVKEIVNLAILNALDERSIDENKKIILKHDHFNKSLDVAGKKKVEIPGFSRNSESRSQPPPEFDDD